MFQGLTGVHLLIILGIVVLLFGATKLPALAKGLGQSINIFKKEMDIDDKDKTTAAQAQAAAAQAAPVQAAPVQAAPVQNVAATAPAEPILNPGPSVQPNTDVRR